MDAHEGASVAIGMGVGQVQVPKSPKGEARPLTSIPGGGVPAQARRSRAPLSPIAPFPPGELGTAPSSRSIHSYKRRNRPGHNNPDHWCPSLRQDTGRCWDRRWPAFGKQEQKDNSLDFLCKRRFGNCRL